MRIYFRNNPAKFHPESIWNGGALGFFEVGRPAQQNEQEAQQDE